MQSTLSIFQGTIQKTAEIIKAIDEKLELGGDYRHAYQVLREVLHALRDRLPHDEAVDLAGQLPILVKGVYFDGWKPSKTPVKMNRVEFLKRIDDHLSLDLMVSAEESIETVLEVLHEKYISEGEYKNLKSVLPKSLAEIFPE